MPCYDGREQTDNERREREYQALTRFACEVLARMEQRGLEAPHYIASWWADHKAHDEEMGRRVHGR